MAKKPTLPTLTDTDKQLLKAALDAGDNGLMVLPTFSQTLVTLGYLETNPTVNDATGIATRITQKGKEFMGVTQPASGPVTNVTMPAASKIAIRTDVPLPTVVRKGNGRVSNYPFDDLPVNGSFHVADVEGKDMAKTLAAAVSNANGRFSKPGTEMETVTVATYQVDATGKRVKADGHFVKTGTKSVTRAKAIKEREFVLRTVTATDPDGAGTRVFRIL